MGYFGKKKLESVCSTNLIDFFLLPAWDLIGYMCVKAGYGCSSLSADLSQNLLCIFSVATDIACLCFSLSRNNDFDEGG